MRNFTIIILVLTLLLGLIGYGLYTTVLAAHYSHALPVLLLVVAAVTLLAHFFLLKAVKQQKQRHFNSIFMSTTVGKLMFYLAGIVLYVVFSPAGAKIFLVNFLVLYLIFMAVELTSIMTYLKKKKER